ncbi:adenine-specific methyltransferase EcoRI family protein [Candidatus Saccharibacteria bacterium]|nr:adenine-specific methyltransferase EcoRI family protein [Candidatus Saccharibacteria bacterium]
MSKGNLYQANRAKKDEFYTQLPDIEKELRHHTSQFKDKTIYCNCDDPVWSNFFIYFLMYFNKLGLKKLIATHYEYEGASSYKLEVENITKDWTSLLKCIKLVQELFEKDDPEVFEKAADLLKTAGISMTPLKGNGDFRSDECISLLEEADIVTTNPPFSLFREYIAQLAEYNKQFLIIGNVNAITYKEVFKLIEQNRVWLGASIHSGDREFGVPDDYPLNAASHRVDERGKKFIRVKGVRWFTNLDYDERHEDLILYKKYSPEEYPKYYNYNAIEVSQVKNIPMDYPGEMGVPITFLDKYNPDQFEIIGKGVQLEKTIRFKGDKATLWIEKDGKPWKAPFERIVIKNKEVKS